jgi:predicted ribosomally synthesized peptide with SipW-like signal peptide
MRNFTSTKRAKIMALAAAGLVLGVGGTVTLAAWVDNEWVYGGNGNGGPGVGTSTFVVEQNRAEGATSGVGTWESQPNNPGGSLTFTGPALALTPGDIIYAPVALRTTVTSVAGTVDTSPAVPATGVAYTDDDVVPANELRDALDLRVGLIRTTAGAAAPTCNAAFFSAPGVQVVTTGTPLTGTFTQDLAIQAAGNEYLHFCFEITLPSTETSATLMGRTLAPAWLFTSTSN